MKGVSETMAGVELKKIKKNRRLPAALVSQESNKKKCGCQLLLCYAALVSQETYLQRLLERLPAALVSPVPTFPLAKKQSKKKRAAASCSCVTS
jgi:hypothetical protein